MSDKVEIVHMKSLQPAGSPYDIMIGCDLMERMARQIKDAYLFDRLVVISDSTVMKLHGNRLTEILRSHNLKVDRIGFPEGASSKSRKMKKYLEDHMLAMGLGPDCCVIACGGGVTGDLAGFTAATYFRGVCWVYVPTTLMAMTDVSIGGKTAIDVPGGKNLIGATHPPWATYIDVSMLETLPRRHLAAGMAEAVKHGVIKDAAFFKLLEKRSHDVLEGDPSAQIKVIERSIRIKAGVLGADETELDHLRILGYGHTFGHAIEAASGYSILHGEALSLGMALEGALALSQDIFSIKDLDRQNALLNDIGLPTKASETLRAQAGKRVRPQEVMEYTHLNMKVNQAMVEYVFPVRIGQMKRRKKKVGIPVDDRTVLRFLRKTSL